MVEKFNKEYLGETYWESGIGQRFRGNNIWVNQDEALEPGGGANEQGPG